MSEGGPDGLIPYYLPDAFTGDAEGNIVPVRNILPRHTVRGRFYENGPYSFCDQGDIHPQPCTCAMPQLARMEVPGNFGEMLGGLLGGQDPEPGPPYVHTFRPPEPEYDDEGNEIWREPGPAFTLTERPVADVVAEAGFGPVPQRVKITADFCQCPACRALRCEP